MPSISTAAAAILANPASVLICDTCVLRDLFRVPYKNLPLKSVSALRSLITLQSTSPPSLHLVLPDLVNFEWHNQSSTAVAELDKEIFHLQDRMRAMSDFVNLVMPGNGLNAPPDFGAAGLPVTVGQLVASFISRALVLDEDQHCTALGAKRVRTGTAPARRGKSELHDCVIVEQTLALMSQLRTHGLNDPACFATSNASDFGRPGELVPPLDTQFASVSLSLAVDFAHAESLL
jgi:hypothetical protein